MKNLSPSIACHLLKAQFPQWASLPLTRINSAGTDHILFKLGPDKVLRFPGTEEAARNVSRHNSWMPRFAGLPLATPEILATGQPGHGFPFSWGILRWIEGEDASKAPIADWATAADRLGRFVGALRKIDTTDGVPSGKDSAYRGCPLHMLDHRIRADIPALSPLYNEGAMISIWESALSATPWQDEPVWVHGDIHAANLVVQDGELVGVIDFGLMSVGDPACDLAPAWSFIPAAFRQSFFEAASADEAAISRGRGWALYFGVIVLRYHADKNPTLAAIATQAIEAVLESEDRAKW